MPITGIGSAADVDPVASLVTALSAATASSLQKASNLSDLASSSTARTNLGLGSAATMTPTSLAADSAFTGSYSALRKLSGFSTPYTICHNGTNNVIPTHTIAGYDYAMSVGLPVMDIDVQVLADGQLANIHDSAVTNTTTSTGNVSTYTSFDFKKLTVDASSWVAAGYADTNPTLVSDILGRYGTRAVYVIEAKDGSTATVTKIVNLVTALGLTAQTVIQSTNLSSLAPAVSAGITANQVTNSPDATALAAAGVSMVTISYSGNTTAITNAVAAGLTVWVYGIQRRYDAAAATALGVTGLMSDDPAYSSSNTAFMTTDTFARQTWAPGHIIAANGRGTLISGGKLQYSVGQNASTLLGFLSPVANAASSYQIDLQRWLRRRVAVLPRPERHPCHLQDRPRSRDRHQPGRERRRHGARRWGLGGDAGERHTHAGHPVDPGAEQDGDRHRQHLPGRLYPLRPAGQRRDDADQHLGHHDHLTALGVSAALLDSDNSTPGREAL
jgi:glycerophosphoryl diester phosphodiesterase